MRVLFVYNPCNQGGDFSAKPHRTANFTVQIDDAGAGDSHGCAGRNGFNAVQNVPTEQTTDILFDDTPQPYITGDTARNATSRRKPGFI